MKSYLSIDLDFWNAESDDHKSLEFFKEVCHKMKGTKGEKIYVVPHHHYLTPHINSVSPDMVYNVDWHSDVSGFADERSLHEFEGLYRKLNCGNWGHFIKNSKKSCFNWIAPSKKAQEDGKCWWADNENPFVKDAITLWKEMRQGISVNNINWSTVEAVGIAASPKWTKSRTVKSVCEILDFDLHKRKDDLYVCNRKLQNHRIKQFRNFWFDTTSI